MIFRSRFKSLKDNAYGDFVMKNEPNPMPYYEAMCEVKGISPKSLFIRGGSGGVHSKHLKALAEKAQEKGFKVIMADDWKGHFDHEDHMYFLKDNTKEYYEALLSAAYVYVGTSLTANYNKPEGQFLVVDLASRNRNNINSRIAMDFMYPEADVVVSANDDSRNEVWEKLLEGKLKSRLRRKNMKQKQKVLIMINTRYYIMVELAKQMLAEMNLDQNEVSILIPQSGLSKYTTQLTLIDKRVHILTYKGTLLCGNEEKRRFQFLKQEGRYLPAIKKVDRFLGKDVFDHEVKRVMRSQSFDLIYNLAFDDLQYKLLMLHMSGKKILINMNNYQSKDPLYCKALEKDLEYLDLYDEIWFENDAKLEPAKQFSQKIIGTKGKLVPHLTHETDVQTTGWIGKTFKFGDDEFLITDHFKGEFLETTSLASVLLPKEAYPYIVPNQIKIENKELFLEQIRQILKEEKTLYVFDVHRILTGTDIANLKYDGVIVRHEGYTALNMLKPYLGEEIHLDGRA